MNEHEALKELRNIFHYTQEELAKKANISVYALQRYENNSKGIQFKDLSKILNIFRLTFNEFFAFMNSQSPFTIHNELFYDTIHNPSETKALKVFDYAAKNKNNSLEDLVLYCKIIRILHDEYPEIIPDFTESELKNISEQLLNQELYSSLDYSVLGLIGIKFSLEIYTELINKMVISTINSPKTIYQLRSDVEFRINFANILNNIVHISLSNNNLESAKHYFYYYQKHIAQYVLTSFNPTIPYYQILINSKLKLTAHDISNLNRFTKALSEVNMRTQSDSYQNEIDKYTLNKNYSEKDRTLHV